MGIVELESGAPPDECPKGKAVFVRVLDLAKAAGFEDPLRRLLSPDEIARAGRLQFAGDRSRFVLARGWLRLVLGRALHVPPETIEFAYGTRGKPTLTEHHKDINIAFNLSHSGDFAMLGISAGRPIGVDIERVRAMPDFQKIADDYFSPMEASAIRDFPEGERLRAFFRCWTRKEAFVKATGEGMNVALDGFSVRLDDVTESRIVTTGVRWAGEWSVRGMTAAPGCEAAVAVAGTETNVSAWLDSVRI